MCIIVYYKYFLKKVKTIQGFKKYYHKVKFVWTRYNITRPHSHLCFHFVSTRMRWPCVWPTIRNTNTGIVASLGHAYTEQTWHLRQQLLFTVLCRVPTLNICVCVACDCWPPFTYKQADISVIKEEINKKIWWIWSLNLFPEKEWKKKDTN